MPNVGNTIKKARKELHLQQKDIYMGIMSRASYTKVESDTKEISLKELSIFSNRLGINFFELLNRSGYNNKSVSEVGKEKILISEVFKNQDLFQPNFQRIKQKRLENLQYYSVYIGYLSLAKIFDIPEITFDKNHLKELENMYKDRHEFYSIDYEIMANLLSATSIDNILPIAKRMFPIIESHGSQHDLTVQVFLKNAITIFILNRDFENAEFFLNQVKHNRTVPHFSLDGFIEIEIVYLEQVYNFLTTKNIDYYLDAIHTVNIFKHLGKNDVHRQLVNELTKISENENFTPPKELSVYYEDYKVLQNKTLPLDSPK
ncbi:helix-turn-helix transcriptional regulator [Enterococcus faecalis]|nr:helix-turn-helix transcriptional regulator [Enterococcus faecalis]MDU2073406.1 helix-turn-helix transcriptional regulator [Streptococcus salivarius]MDU6989838.1 helix-turn-helix transcriptional regulator [Escherichia coli]EFM77403.1 DNA-binding helix-turn-helix protein [Enterococcus faecalis TX2134]EGO2601807.1 helix-turn-helix transcriptional regulator [Enterococcus faecalis]EGO5063062.1 helix-turn-helix transcriptional regulator [Enterococcus faecalis]